MVERDDKHKTRAFRYTTTKINPADLEALQKGPKAEALDSESLPLKTPGAEAPEA